VIITLDAMGGDKAPAEPVRGALLAHKELGLQVALVGQPELLRQELERDGPVPSGIEIVAASEAIGMHEQPVQAVRQKKNASINVAMGLVKSGVANALVSAGNTGAVMTSALLHLGRVPGIERPALGTIAPYRETGILVLDVGANADCRPSYLLQFAQMGHVYAERVLGIHNPRIGLLNIGEEPTKGSEFAQEVFERLQHSGLNFVGNVEPDRIHRDVADVVVTDGFTGNVAVKTVEGVVDFIFSQLRGALTSRLQYRLAALVLRPALLGLRQRLDYSEFGGVPLLGVNGVVMVAHGNASAHAIGNALRVAQEAASQGMMESLREAFAGQRRAAAAVTSGDASNS
jgi:glycerol-3-phosphate acyltransferase PlsX